MAAKAVQIPTKMLAGDADARNQSVMAQDRIVMLQDDGTKPIAFRIGDRRLADDERWTNW